MDCFTAKELIDFAYGANADLYKDVFNISRDASKDDIEFAFIDRTYELNVHLKDGSLTTKKKPKFKPKFRSKKSKKPKTFEDDPSGNTLSLMEKRKIKMKIDAL